MNRNPFVLSPTIPDELFCDRLQETDALLKCITNQVKSPSAVQAAVKRLLDYDLLTEQGKTYSVTDPLLRIWITR